MRIAPLVIPALSLALAACGPGPSPKPADGPPRAAAKSRPDQRLDSGLRWVFERMPGAPGVAVQLWLPAGATTDPADHPGTAALAALTAGARLDAALTPTGGRAEGWARGDATAIALTVVPERLGDALGALATVIDSAPGEAEAAAARRVFEGRVVSAGLDPDRRALQRLRALAWGAHPAARPIVGVSAPPADVVERWRAVHHRPVGAVLVVAGDIDDPRAAIGEALGGWSGAPTRLRQSPPKPPPKGPVVQVDPRPGETASIRLAWPVPADDPEATARADALALSLVTGDDAPLTAALNRAGIDARLAAFVYAPADHGLLVVSVDAPAADVDRAWRALAEGMAHARRHPPSRTRLARVVDALDGAGARAAADPSTLAAHIGPRALRWPGGRDRWRAALDGATPADIAPLAASLKPRSMIAWLGTPLPEGLDGGLWGERLAEAFTAEKAAAGLASGFPGVVAQVVPRPGAGIVALHVRCPAGEATVPPDMLGAAELAARALAEPLPDGGRPAVSLGPDALDVTLTVPAERFPEAAGALFDRLLRPRWPGARVEKARARALAHHRPGPPGEAAYRLLAADLARVAGAPTAEPEAVQAGLETVPPARVAAWFDGFVTHGALRVVAVGDLDEADLYRVLAASVPSRRPGVSMRPLHPPAEAHEGVHRTDRRVDGDRAAWALGWVTGPVSDDALAALEVSLALLARGAELDRAPLDVRLLVETRGQRARVGLVVGGPVAEVRAAVPRVFAALDERTQVAALGDVSSAAIRWLVGRRAVQLTDAGALARWIAGHSAAGRSFVGPRALPQWRSAVERARGGQTLAVVREHLTPGGRFEVWVGPGAPPETPTPPVAPAPPADPPEESP